MNASEALQKAQQLIDQRGRDYDHEGGERSMGAAVTAFNALTGHDLTDGDGWLLFELVKTKRSKSSPGHVDSNIDKISYSALRAEAELRDAKKPKYDADATLRAMADPEFWRKKQREEDRDIANRTRGILADGDECGIYEVRQAHPLAGSPPPQKFGCRKCKVEWGAGEIKPCRRDIGIPTSEQNQSDSDESWVDHDGSDTCPLTDESIRIDVQSRTNEALAVAAECVLDWRHIKRWRIAEVDGWVRNRDHVMPKHSQVDVVYRNGLVDRNRTPARLRWSRIRSPGDIIAYRIEKDGA